MCACPHEPNRTEPSLGNALREHHGAHARSASYPRPSGNYPRPSVNYPRPSASYPRPSVNYPRPSVNYPRPSVNYPRPSVGYKGGVVACVENGPLLTRDWRMPRQVAEAGEAVGEKLWRMPMEDSYMEQLDSPIGG
eukprot:1180428-Prorocentrum_minimum.AAC.4